MTSISADTPPLRTADLGTLVIMSWSRDTPDGAVPFLLACSLGNGENGPEASSVAVRLLLAKSGLTVGDSVTDATVLSDFPVSLLVVPGVAALTMPGVNAQFAPTPAWRAAVDERGFACLIFTTRPWSGGEPGEAAAVAAFANHESTLASAAQIILPVRSLRV
ncbi:MULTISPECIES: DUF5949 family protein [unclassified Streptomyces]|uniref:DUF5949 family protein n=1 Tax=unclassified Streptomyces TaxID=2593676 RepID=UPI002238BD63|nr:DUF5949 family protein [Streptomyces sp. SHP 1-2]MCW5252602.1 hypothetical protein [Streptomyces sp. SHP 1-2]